MRARLLRHEKITDEIGNTVEIKIWQVPVSKDKPHGCRYSLVYIVDNKRVIGYDNAKGKRDHRHYREKEEPYRFVNLRRLTHDFCKDIEMYKEGKL